MSKPKIAIIGAGISGLTLASRLSPIANIKVFEKSRGFGGRMSTRYASGYQFDHGAQYFSARSSEFKEFLDPFIQDKTIAIWKPNLVILEKGQKSYQEEWLESRYVASPKMNSLCRKLAEDLDISLQTRIQTLKQQDHKWTLIDIDSNSFEDYDWVISTAPAPQTLALMPNNFSQLEMLKQVKMLACYTLMLGLNKPLNLTWDAAKVKNSLIGWIAVNSHKPDRNPDAYSLLIQTTNTWAEANLEQDINIIQEQILAEWEELTSIKLRDIGYITTHSWLYANIQTPANCDFLVDENNCLAACGDWCISGKVESAFMSAWKLGDYFLNR